jgi:hypothetical protein
MLLFLYIKNRMDNVSEEPAASAFGVEEISLRTVLLIIAEYKCGPE